MTLQERAENYVKLWESIPETKRVAFLHEQLCFAVRDAILDSSIQSEAIKAILGESS